jgi:hypothetical protein
MARHRLLPKARISGCAVVQGVALAGLAASLIRPEFLVRGKKRLPSRAGPSNVFVRSGK